MEWHLDWSKIEFKILSERLHRTLQTVLFDNKKYIQKMIQDKHISKLYSLKCILNCIMCVLHTSATLIYIMRANDNGCPSMPTSEKHKTIACRARETCLCERTMVEFLCREKAEQQNCDGLLQSRSKG